MRNASKRHMSEQSVDEEPGSEGSRTRHLSTFWRCILLVWTVVSILLCFNQQFTLRFFVGLTLLDTEYYWGLVLVLLPLAFIIYPVKPGLHQNHVPVYDILLFLLTTTIAGYLIYTARTSAAEGWEYSAPSVAGNLALGCAIAMWALVLEALRRAGGLVLFVIMGLFSLFPLFAASMPAPLTASSVSLLDTASYHIFSRESVLGIPMRAFAELVIGFLVFGTALQYSGAGAFFINLAFALCGTYRGGAAKVAIFSSGLLGSMSGSVISNVLTTGTMTIPAMKKTGFRPAMAGAIEACASTGAVLAPPVMGATAFVMAEFLNIPYSERRAGRRCSGSAVLLLACSCRSTSIAGRNSMVGMPREEMPKLSRRVPRRLVLHLRHHPAGRAAAGDEARELGAVAGHRAAARSQSALLRQALGLERSCCAFIEGNGRVFVELVAILAGIGLLVGAFSLTGLTGTLTTELLYLAGDQPLLLMLMGALTSFILGMGMTITACYIFLAVLLAPSLIKVGLDPLAVHMFIMYWGMVSFHHAAGGAGRLRRGVGRQVRTRSRPACRR